MKASLGAKSLPRPLEWLKKAGVGRWPLIGAGAKRRPQPGHCAHSVLRGGH